MRRNDGLTLIEVLVSLTILVTIVTVFSTALVSGLQNTRYTGNKLEATQLLNYFGRMASGGATRPLPFAFNNTQQPWGYGQLTQTFPELVKANTQVRDPNNYKVTATTPGTITIGTAQLVRYHLQVCWRERGRENCIEGDTAGPRPTAFYQLGAGDLVTN